MTRKVLMLIAAAALLAAAPAAPNAQDITEKPAETPAAAPADVLAAFIKAVKETPTFQAAQAMPMDKIEAKIAEWRTALDVEFKLETRMFIETLFGEGVQCRIGDRTYWMETEGEERDNIQVVSIHLVYQVPAAGERPAYTGRYVVAPAKLADFSFEYVAGVRLLHKSARVLPSFNVVNATLTETIAKLAGEINAEYIIRSDLADNARLTLKLRNRTIAECLYSAASAAGWTINVPAGYGYASYQEVAETYANREFLNLTVRGKPRIESMMDALQYLVTAYAEGVRAQNLITVRPQTSKDR